MDIKARAPKALAYKRRINLGITPARKNIYPLFTQFLVDSSLTTQTYKGHVDILDSTLTLLGAKSVTRGIISA